MTKFYKTSLFILMVFLAIFQLSAQEETEGEKDAQKTSDPVQFTFLDGRLINAQTVQMPAKKALKFRIIHRFGVIEDENIVQDFFSFDLSANIRFSLHYGLTERLEVGVGRTKFGKQVDFNGKYLLLQQTKDNSIPVSLAGYFNAAISTQDQPPIQPGTTFEEGGPFINKFAHRWSYNTQLIIGRKFNENLSMQITPVLIYENLITDPERDHATFAIMYSGRYKYSFSSAIIWEYSVIATNHTDDIVNPLSLGVEFGTAGHAFQLFLTTSQEILEQQLYTEDTEDFIDKRDFLIGFNIRRTWWF